MDSAESCIRNFLTEKGHLLTGWRLFSTPARDFGSGRNIQYVTAFQPIAISGEAIAYARTISTEIFRVKDGFEVYAGCKEVPQELLGLLADPYLPNSSTVRGEP